LEAFLMKKWLVILAAVLVSLLGLGMVWEPLATTSLTAPPTKSYNVEIIRDEFGVPHIHGKTDADAAYGLAYAHAEDDFATLQDVVAMTRGRYGAIAGPEGAQIDYVGGLLRIRQTAERQYAQLSPDVRLVLEAYAAGLNRYADTHPKDIKLAKLFPVTGQDIVAGFVLRAPFFSGLDSTIGALVSNKAPSPRITPGLDPDREGSQPKWVHAFALAPKKMSDGKTWLISNSHQPYEGQVAWYEAVMHSDEGLDMAGVLFPGSPFILMGHNRNLGWTNTINRPDLIDVYKLTLNDKGDQYKLDGQWRPL
jgi:acyl-homoserine-lactone acylase